jgi:hypothetical protein
MTSPKNLLVCPDCDDVWPANTGRYCAICHTEGEPYPDDGDYA